MFNQLEIQVTLGEYGEEASQIASEEPFSLGDRVPDFELLDQDSESNRLSDYWDSTVLLFFFAKASAPGCALHTARLQLCLEELKPKGLNVLAVSGDSPAKLRRLADKEYLSFPLLSDPEHKVSRAFGAWGSKEFLGKSFYGVRPSSFLLKPAGFLGAAIKEASLLDQFLWTLDQLGLPKSAFDFPERH